MVVKPHSIMNGQRVKNYIGIIEEVKVCIDVDLGKVYVAKVVEW